MINFYDTSAVHTLVSARQEQLASRNYQRSSALAALNAARGQSHPVREMIGKRLIRAGARLSGISAQRICVTPAGTNGSRAPLCARGEACVLV
jgi:hypothetical protein